MASCSEKWLDWNFECALEYDHTGPHYALQDDRIAYWGGPVKQWVRAS